jgi:regulator of cell morphogenesis and NO signaling
MIWETTALLREFARRPIQPEPSPEPRPAPFDIPQLIAHILERYHAVHRAEFPEAIRLARRVEAVHGGHPDCPRHLGDHLAMMADDLEGHQLKEERVLFPMMLNGGGPPIAFPINRMMAEHRDVDDQLAHLADLTHGFTAPEGVCASWRELYQACRKIDAGLREHMRIENDILFASFLN